MRSAALRLPLFEFPFAMLCAAALACDGSGGACTDTACEASSTGTDASTGVGEAGTVATTAASTSTGVGSSAGETSSAGDSGSQGSDASSSAGGDTEAPLLDLGGTSTGRGFYMTDFPLDEDPISEGGAWTAISSPWLRIRTGEGLAQADAYVDGYNDNYAHLQGFGPDVEITATVYVAGPPPYGEILLLARMADTADSNRGYEYLYDADGSVQLMRWNGGFGDFTPMGGESFNPGPLQDFDQLRLRVQGNTITAYHRRPPDDWVEVGQTTDDTWADGEPGMGFFVRDEGQTIEGIGLRDYMVEEI